MRQQIVKSSFIDKVRTWRIVGGCLLSLTCWPQLNDHLNAQSISASAILSEREIISIAPTSNSVEPHINNSLQFHVAAAFESDNPSKLDTIVSTGFAPVNLTTPIQIETSHEFDLEQYRSDLPNLPNATCDQPVLLNDTAVIKLACQKSAVRRLLSRESFAAGLNTTQPTCRDSSINSSVELYQRFLRNQAVRQSQLSAENAMKAHYGIRSLNRSIELITQLLNEIETQQDQLNTAMDQGLPVGDLTVLERARLDALSSLSESNSKLAGLRSQLALLIGTEYACCYQPNEIDGSLPSNDELCTWIQASSSNRRDLIAYRQLARCLTIENLDVARLASANITGNTAISTNLGRRWIYRLFRRSEEALEKELTTRRAQLNEYAIFLQSQISAEIETAWHSRASAIDRWNLAVAHVETWQTRLEQLNEMDRLGRPDAQNLFTAKLEYLRSQLTVVERWNAYHQSHIELLSASGLTPCL